MTKDQQAGRMQPQNYDRLMQRLHQLWYDTYSKGQILRKIIVRAVTKIPDNAIHFPFTYDYCLFQEEGNHVVIELYIPVGYEEQPVVFIPKFSVWRHSLKDKPFNQELYDKYGLPSRIAVKFKGNFKILPAYTPSEAESFDAIDDFYQSAISNTEDEHDEYARLALIAEQFDEDEFNNMSSLAERWMYLQQHFIRELHGYDVYQYHSNVKFKMSSNFILDCLKFCTEEPPYIAYEDTSDLEEVRRSRAYHLQRLTYGLLQMLEPIGSASKKGLKTSGDIDFILPDLNIRYASLYRQLKNCPYLVEVKSDKFREDEFSFAPDGATNVFDLQHICLSEVTIFKINRKYIPFATDTYIYVPNYAATREMASIHDKITARSFLKMIECYKNKLQPDTKLWEQYQQGEITKSELFTELYYLVYPDQRKKIEPAVQYVSNYHHEDDDDNSYSNTTKQEEEPWPFDNNSDYDDTPAAAPVYEVQSAWSYDRGEYYQDNYGNEWDARGNALGNNPYGNL